VTLSPIELVVSRAAHGTRVDRFVAGAMRVSRSEVARWIDGGRVTVDAAECEASARVREGQRVWVDPMPPAQTAAEADPAVRFDVLYVDGEVIVLDKPAGLVVHPGRGHAGGTLVNGLLALGLFRHEDWAPSSGGDGGSADETHLRPGIVHRLDKGTSGVLVVARHAAAREALKAQFQAHTIARAYEAIVVGAAKGGTIATMHGRDPKGRMRFTARVTSGKRAVTHVRVVAALRGATHVECRLETGRTHQIRVHMAESGTPVLGDPLYGRPPRDARVREVAIRLGHQALHARMLGFVHPRTGATMTFESPPPPDFAEALSALRA